MHHKPRGYLIEGGQLLFIYILLDRGKEELNNSRVGVELQINYETHRLFQIKRVTTYERP